MVLSQHGTLGLDLRFLALAIDFQFSIKWFFTFPKISPKAEIYSIKALIYLYKRKKGHFEKFFFRGWERRWEGEEKQHQT